MSEALATRALSGDPKAKLITQSGVGAVIVKADVELARSANVLPPALAAALEGRGRIVEDADRYHLIEHAERAAIYTALMADHDLKGATIYCTRFPCSDCARAIIWAGMTRAVFPMGFGAEERWIEAQRAAREMLRTAGVTIRYLPSLPIPK